ncbi:hypothetical protein CEXT_281471 [Caerostris extrusa]|uniref:Secreted protein n=1 Tax=Caerostris extrusa TaxID=172846 RepID=A0AAV4Y208_CAEEX|nr:hypothetical protein CEXT_281471 [Caerostris extrusa]
MSRKKSFTTVIYSLCSSQYLLCPARSLYCFDRFQKQCKWRNRRWNCWIKKLVCFVEKHLFQHSWAFRDLLKATRDVNLLAFGECLVSFVAQSCMFVDKPLRGTLSGTWAFKREKNQCQNGMT